MKYDLNRAKKCVEILDKRRLERALSGASDGFQHVLSLFPLLFQLNHPSLSGYMAQSLYGVANFKLSDYQQQFLSSEYPELYGQIKDPPYGDNPPILGIYVMGSFGSISQSRSSDMDIWICCREDLTENERNLLEQKAQKNQRMGNAV